MEAEVALDTLKAQDALADARDAVYLHNADYAREYGELPFYRQSIRLNKECAQAIDAAITANWDGSKLNPEGARAVLKQYGKQRVVMVLANTLNYMDYDLRFSSANREWAKGFPALEGSGAELNSHPVKLDSFVDQAVRGGLERDSGQRTPSAANPKAEEKTPTLAGQLAEAKQRMKPPETGDPGKKRDKGLG
jgi:hypothetical protein